MPTVALEHTIPSDRLQVLQHGVLHAQVLEHAQEEIVHGAQQFVRRELGA